MKKEIRTFVDVNGVKMMQVTTADERWYVKEGVNTITKMPAFDYAASVTWISEFYPKGIGFYKWLAQRSWDESEALKEAAADKGSRVHNAVNMLINGKSINIDDKIPGSDGVVAELTLEEWEAVMSFVEWANDRRPVFKQAEFVVWDDTFSYAGTVDATCEMGGVQYIVDFKTSQAVWPSHVLQVSAYNQALGGQYQLMILQLGYKRNKKNYKENIVEDQFNLFLAAREIWKNETKGQKPLQRDYPVVLSLKKEAGDGDR